MAVLVLASDAILAIRQFSVPYQEIATQNVASASSSDFFPENFITSCYRANLVH